MRIKLQSLITIFLIVGLTLVTPNFQGVLSYSGEDYLSYLSVSDQADEKQAYQFLQKLCSQEFEGRQTGTKGGELAANWISEMFKGFGLTPAYQEDMSFLQTFNAPCYNLLPEISFMLTTKEGNTPYVYKQDFVPSPSSASGTSSGAIVFVGYGISSPENNYDDYGGVDVKNKIVLMLRKSPTTISLPENDAYFSTKISNAKNHGAIGVIIAEKDGEKNPYSMLSKSATGTLSNGCPAVFIPTSVANQILEQSNTNVKELQTMIDETKSPNSRSIKAGAYIQINLSIETKETSNVIGYIPAEDPSVEESVLVTAHYDHLGIDLVNGDLYPGANDNASGVATLIEISRVLTSNCFIPKVNVVFVAFSGEEEGLLGSAYYIEHPLFPLKNTLAVLNMDMVGTGTGDIYAGTNFTELIENIDIASNSLKMKVPISKSLVNGGSDQLLFARKNIPAVFFIRSNPTGLGDYHSPLDTADTVDPKNLLQQAKLVIMVCCLYADPKTLFFDTKSDYWFQETSVHGRIIIHAKGSPGIIVRMQDKSYKVSQSGIFEKLVQLQEGSNLIQVQILKSDQEIILERMISIQAKINEQLDADLNFDKKVDFTDLLIFSKHYPLNKVTTALEDLCDMNLDQKIDEKDFIWLKNRYAYQLEK